MSSRLSGSILLFGVVLHGRFGNGLHVQHNGNWTWPTFSCSVNRNRPCRHGHHHEFAFAVGGSLHCNH
jgi:hypothetical protein